MENEALRVAIQAPVARITLNRPAIANRIDARFLRELVEACEAIDARNDIALTVIDAAGPDFCAGWEEATRDELLHTPPANPDPFGCLARLPCPVLACLRGVVIGAGLELALACDMRIAAADARFALPDVSLGALPLAGGSQRLPRIVGRSAATSMLLLGDEIDAGAAYRCGLVSRVLPVDDFEAACEALVRRIAANGPVGLRYAKEAVHNGLEMSLDQGLRYELDLSVILQTTQDRTEGVNAFLEKREPRFEGH